MHGSILSFFSVSARATASIVQLQPAEIDRPVTFRCDFSGEPPLTVIWFHNETSQGPFSHTHYDNSSSVRMDGIIIDTFETYQMLTMLQFKNESGGMIGCSVMAPAAHFLQERRRDVSMEIIMAGGTSGEAY